MDTQLYIHNKKNIEDVLSCPICLDIYKHPRNLICGHVFCSTCLYLIKINNNILCPLCCHNTKLSKNYTLADLPVNSMITSIIDNSNLYFKKPGLKRSKSVNSLLNYNKITNKQKKIFNYYLNFNNTFNDNNIISTSNNIISDNLSEPIPINNHEEIDIRENCCTYQ